MYYFHFLSFQAKRIKSSRKIGRREAGGRWEAVGRPFVTFSSLCCSLECNVLFLLLICKEAKQGHWKEQHKDQKISNDLSLSFQIIINI